MVFNGRPLKRMKRRVTADLYDFLSFPSSAAGVGPFRSSVRSFLSKHALLPPPSSLFPHLMTWQILFRVGDLTEGPDSSPAVVCVDIVEEDVARSRSLYCDQCRVVGVCKATMSNKVGLADVEATKQLFRKNNATRQPLKITFDNFSFTLNG